MDLRTKEILDSLASGVVVVDLESRLLFINRAVARRLGVDGKAWLGKPAQELIRSIQTLSGSREEPDLNWTAAGDRGTHSRELSLKLDQDTAIWLREDSRPLRDATGQVIGRVFAYHDIGREKAIDRMKSEFIAVASHELRTPMTSIKGSVDLILTGFTGPVSGETQELLEIAQKNCERLVRLINDILDLAKIEAGQIRLRPTRMDIADAVERALRGVKSLADSSDVRLTIRRSADVLPIEADRDRLEQVVTNLLSNAIKFSPPNGEVCVELSGGEGWVQCSVIDQGCGIPEDQLTKVFGKFEQVANSSRKGGTGLGLAIAQALVHEHRGVIWVESRLNEGSKFTFRLPAAAAVVAAS